ncbi:MAG: hypothetical protein EBT15_10940 [Betaproteobacteria bacterium]|nr:hypothetical protein [Betaproteobacteria bacterium]
MTAFPSSVAARKLLKGENYTDSVFYVLRRTLLIRSGLRLAGEEKDLWKKSLYGSLAVQAFVTAWTATHMDEPVASLPSGEVAIAGDAVGILGTYLLRSAIVGTGLWLSGERKHLTRNTLISTALIEASVLLWAKDQEV